jgi:uncharacterized protein involved in outer membrane biogenesis
MWPCKYQMIKWLFKWLFRLFLAVAVLIVIFLLSLNSILRVVIEHNIRAQTGMDAEMGRFKLGWLSPTIEIQDLKIYNTPNFGGAPFLDIPEIHVEYDRTALLKGGVHLPLLRFNLEELDIVKNQDGQMNVYSASKPPQNKSAAAPSPAPSFKKQTGYSFNGIDTLNVSFNRVKFIDLKNPANDREQTIGIQNLVVPHVKSPNDLAFLVILIDLRSNHFFDGIIGKPANSAAEKSILNVLGLAF